MSIRYAGGIVLGLYRRRWTIARVWRTFVVAAAPVYIGPAMPIYPDILVGSLGTLTISPVIASWRRRDS